MSTIVVGYDASDAARKALATAVDLARPLGDQVHVVIAYDLGSRLGGEVADFAAALRERALRLGTLASDEAAGMGFEVTTEVIEDRASDALVDVAEQLDARMIVVGSRGEGPIRRALVGSIPHRLLQGAERPILVVPE